MLSLPQYNSSDLTDDEIKGLIKDFFVYSFICFLIFGAPYVLLGALSQGAEGAVSEEQFLWLRKALGLGFIVLVGVLLVKDLPYTLKYFGDMFSNLGTIAAGLSRSKRLLGLAFVVGYFYSAIRYPVVWIWFTILIFTPAGFTYDRYKTILKRKAENRIGKDTSRGEDRERFLD